MPNDNIPSDDYGTSTASSIADTVKKEKLSKEVGKRNTLSKGSEERFSKSSESELVAIRLLMRDGVQYKSAEWQPDLISMQQQILDDELTRWQMRWWLFRVGFIFSFVWMILVIGLSTYVFIRTGSVFSLFISAAIAPALEFIRRFANYLLPMDEKRYILAAKKIEAKILRYSNRMKHL